MPPGARANDNILQDAPHCHAPIHPPAPTPTPTPHPALPLAIMPPCSLNVKYNNMAAARVSDMSKPCMLPTCVPGGPGIIAKGSSSVFVNKLPAARVGDLTQHATCVAPIPSPVGKIIPPGSTSVMIGG
jgi:uncharacterized Zn-binding protein involved in type VI secretion